MEFPHVGRRNLSMNLEFHNKVVAVVIRVNGPARDYNHFVTEYPKI